MTRNGRRLCLFALIALVAVSGWNHWPWFVTVGAFLAAAPFADSVMS